VLELPLNDEEMALVKKSAEAVSSSIAALKAMWQDRRARLTRDAPAPIAGVVDAHELIARMSPLQKGYFTAEAQRPQRKML